VHSRSALVLSRRTTPTGDEQHGAFKRLLKKASLSVIARSVSDEAIP
jgi:hypothetical protein